MKPVLIVLVCLLVGCGQIFKKTIVPQEIDPQPAWKTQEAVSADGKLASFMPEFDGSSIVCGNKLVKLSNDGQIVISNEGGVLARINIYMAYRNTVTDKIDWTVFSAGLCTMQRDGNELLWVLRKSYGSRDWKAAEQSLRITPEGLISIQAVSYPPPEDMAVVWRSQPQLFIFTPLERADGTRLLYNGEQKTMSSAAKSIVGDFKSQKFNYEFYANSPSGAFSILGKKPQVGAATSCYPDVHNKAFRTVMEFTKQNTVEFTIDLRKGIAPRPTSANVRGGINFKKIENIELPDSAHKNLFQNASFERDLEGYRVKHANYDRQWHWQPFAIDSQEACFGNHSLKMDARPTADADYRRLRQGVNLTTSVAVVSPGFYTSSFYAKCESGNKAMVHTWMPNFHAGSLFAAFDRNAIGKFEIGSDWKRYSTTFEVKQPMPLEMHLNTFSLGTENCAVWIDDIQLEKGGESTGFEPVPAEGRLITSDPQNFIQANDRIDARMQITTAQKNATGKMAIQVKNFFGEILLERDFPFISNQNRVAEVPLPLDDLPGLGVFVVRTDFILDDQTSAYQFQRYSKINFLTEDRSLKKQFALSYGHPELHFDFLTQLERWQKLGIGCKHHHHTFQKDAWDAERQYGVEPSHAFMASFLRDSKRKLIGFCILDSDQTDNYVSPDDPRILVRDFHFDADGKITPEYLAKFKQAARTVAAKNPHVSMWCFAGEVIAKFPAEWWSKAGTDEELARIHALLLKAFVEGVKEGNPNAKVFQDDPCNMRPEGGIAETERLLIECNKLGVKFDVLAIHPYRFSPESPDLDADTGALLAMLEKHGYGNTPVIWPEGMHWGPFNIPQWGTDSSTWGGVPRTWPGSLLSYDMGWTEKKSAAWYARTWLVSLKYSDRILGATAGNTSNNCYMDVLLTPYAAQLIPNTLGNILGNSKFQKDVRFAPFTRAYVFEDAMQRPVAAVWCHLDKVDNGSVSPPQAEADFGNSLESVLDLMNTPRQFTKGVFRFPVSSFPLFLRGKPGTLKQMTAALEQAVVVSGEGISPLGVAANPLNAHETKITFQNFLSRQFKGTMDGKEIVVPGSGSANISTVMNKTLTADKISKIPLQISITADSGAGYNYDLSFEALLARAVLDAATFETLDWATLPSIPFVRRTGDKTQGSFRIGWNASGLFVETVVHDQKFVHVEYPKTGERWKNDCLQLYVDTLANARARSFKGYDEDDYDYAVFPNASGNSSIVYRSRSVEQQLGLATQAPPDNTIAADIPSSFSDRDGVLTYRVFFPAKYLLPMKLEKGWVFGLGLYAANSDEPGKVDGALTLAEDGKGCYNKPHTWPAVLLVE